MSVVDVEKRIQRFLSSEEPEIITIKGEWGVGKTYTWNKFRQEAVEEKRINPKFEYYSYVSLFGISDLESVKLSIFGNLTPFYVTEKKLPWKKMWRKNCEKFGIGREVLGKFKFLEEIPKVKYLTPIIKPMLFSSIKKSVICIDDIDRMGNNISLKELLGVALTLKEQKGCKVLLIFNQKEFNENDRNTYREFFEKIVDAEIEFELTPEEAVEIALNGEDFLTKKLKEFSIKLRIKNIRILRKIERNAKYISELLGNFGEEILGNAIHTLCLFSYCLYVSDKNESVPSIDYLKKCNKRLVGLLNYGKEKNEKERKWDEFLEAYGFTYFDELDEKIMELVEKGCLQEESFKEQAKKLSEETNILKSIKGAWKLYRNSFSNNQEEVVASLTATLRENIHWLGLMDLSDIVTFFRDLGKSNMASRLIDEYFEANSDKDVGVFDLSSNPFGQYVTDKEMREKCALFYNEKREKRDLYDVLLNVAKTNSWTKEDITVLENATSDKFYDAFKQIEGCHFKRFVSFPLGNHSDDSNKEPWAKINSQARQALEKIASENPLNKVRVEKIFGVQLDNEHA